MRPEFIPVGRIVNAHGIRGEVKLNPEGCNPGFLTAFDTLYIAGEPVRVLSSRVHKSVVLLTLPGVTDMDAALALKGKVVSIRREDARLPEGEYFDEELVGLTVLDDASGEELGRVDRVLTYPAHKIYQVKGAREYLIPAVPGVFIASVDPEFLIAALELLGSVLSFRSQKFFNFLSGRPKTVILDGKIDQNALRMLRLTTADLMEALRGKNILDPREVSYAVIETNGTLSAALRPEKEPVRLSDLQIKVNHANAIIPFVLDGQVLEDNLRWCGKDREWLERTAQANTLLPEEILLLIGSETEDYFLLKKEDRHGSGSR